MSETPRPWPQADLEAVPNCPVCGSAERSLLYQGLTDRVFCVADGAWNLYRCAHCASGYLDPRPSAESIGRAYAGYYTHDAEDHPIVRRKGRIRSFLHDLINGYQNHRYGLQRSPALPMGRWLLPLLPSLRTAADAECRHLPPLPFGGGGDDCWTWAAAMAVFCCWQGRPAGRWKGWISTRARCRPPARAGWRCITAASRC